MTQEIEWTTVEVFLGKTTTIMVKAWKIRKQKAWAPFIPPKVKCICHDPATFLVRVEFTDHSWLDTYRCKTCLRNLIGVEHL